MADENNASAEPEILTDPPTWFDVLDDAVGGVNAWIGWKGYFAEAIAGYAMALFVYYRPTPSYFSPELDALIIAVVATGCLLSAAHSYFFE